MFGLSAIAGLFGGGDGASALPAGPTTQTVSTGPVSFGSKYLGRGSVTSSDTAASGGSAITGTPGAPQSPSAVYVVAGLAALALLVLAIRK